MAFSQFVAPILPDLSLGGLLGFSAGYAVKKVGRAALFVIGVIFVVIQVLAYAGFIEVNWTRVQDVAQPAVEEGARRGAEWLWAAVRANVPFGAAFTGGVLLGLRVK